MNVFEEFKKQQNLLFKLERLLASNAERDYKELFYIPITREELEIVISKFKPKEN